MVDHNKLEAEKAARRARQIDQIGSRNNLWIQSQVGDTLRFMTLADFPVGALMGDVAPLSPFSRASTSPLNVFTKLEILVFTQVSQFCGTVLICV